MSETKYNEIQLNKLYRRQSDICAFQVLSVTQEGIVIQLPKVFGENKTTDIPLSSKTKALYKVGDYADGTASSFQAKYWGPTPAQFVPASGDKISKA